MGRSALRLVLLRWAVFAAVTLSCSLIAWFWSRPIQTTNTQRLVVPIRTGFPHLQAMANPRSNAATTGLDGIELEVVDGDKILIPIDLIDQVSLTHGTPQFSCLARDGSIETSFAEMFGITDFDRDFLNRSLEAMIKKVDEKAIEGLQAVEPDGELEYLELPPMHTEVALALDAMLAESSLSQSKRRLFKEIFLKSNLGYRLRATRLVPNLNEDGAIVSFDYLSAHPSDGGWGDHRRMGVDLLEIENREVALLIEREYGHAIAVIKPYLLRSVSAP